MTHISIEVDVDEVLDQISDEQIAREVTERGLHRKDDRSAKEVVSRAVVLIKSGRVSDGVTMLEREFFPTWKDTAACEAAYAKAMALKVAA
jgi:hypothetical protein